MIPKSSAIFLDEREYHTGPSRRMYLSYNTAMGLHGATVLAIGEQDTD